MIKYIKGKFFSKELYRNSAKLFMGHTMGQIIVFLSGPILSRIYNPEEFGNYALLSTIAGIISVISSGSYEVASITAKEENEANSLSIISISLSIAGSFISAIIIFFLFLGSGAMNQSLIHSSWVLIPIFVLIQGINNAVNHSLNRKKEYNTMSFSRMVRAATMVPIQTLLGIKGVFSGLFIGMIIGHSTGTLFQLKKVFRTYIKTLKSNNKNKLKKIAKKHYKYPLYYLPEQLLNSISAHAPIFLLKIFFSEGIIGLYALPRKFLSAPVILIGNSMGQIYFREAALIENNEEDLAKTTKSLFRFLFRLGLLPFSLLTIWGDIIIRILFGQEWEMAGVYTMILSPYLFMLFIGSPLSNIFAVKGKQKLSLTISIYLFLARISSFLIGTFVFQTALASIALFAFVSFVFWLFTAFYNLYLSKNRIWPLLKETILIWLVVLALLVLTRFLFN